MPYVIRTLGTAAAAAVVAAAIVSAEAPSASRGVDLAVPGRANATPTMAARDRFVAVAWGASTPRGATDVYTAISRDGGRTFGAPVRVNGVSGRASLGGEQPPHVALIPRAGADPDILVLWTAKENDGTRLLTARSTDGGRSFGRASPVPGSVAPGNRGWESLGIDRDGRPVAVWLDHRELAGASGAAMHHAAHEHGATSSSPPAVTADGVARAQRSKLYFARLDDPSSAHAVASGVCYCCKTAVATSADGAVYAAWRHVYPGSLRDIAFAASHDGGRTFAPPVRVSEDGWALDGCPENGPTLAVGAGGIVHVVWPTLVPASSPDTEPSLALFYAATTDGQRFSPRQRLPTRGTPRHPQMIAKPDGSLVIAWDAEVADGRRRVAAVFATADGSSLRIAAVPLDEDGARGEYPVVAAGTDATLVAWTSGEPMRSVIRVVRVP